MRTQSLLLFIILPVAILAAPQATPPRVRGSIDLTIGGSDNAAKECTFGSVSGLTLGADGRIYVADGQDNQIRVYGADGKYQFSIGNKGAGPGEFNGMRTITIKTDSSISSRYFSQPFGATSIVAFGPRGESARGITSR